MLLNSAVVAPEGDDELERHEPVTGGLVRLIERRRRSREFDRAMPTSWYLAAIISLGHAAGQEVIAGRMTPAKAGAAFTESVLRVCRAHCDSLASASGDVHGSCCRTRSRARDARLSAEPDAVNAYGVTLL